MGGLSIGEEKEQESTSKPAEKLNNKKSEEKKVDNKTSNQKKTTNKKTSKTTESRNTDKPSKQNDEEKNRKTPVEKVPQKNNKKEDKAKKEEKHKHRFTVNGGWYKTSDEAIRKFQSISDQWNKKYEDGEISWDEYCRKCPTGYEIYRCTCGMQGLNLMYD